MTKVNHRTSNKNWLDDVVYMLCCQRMWAPEDMLLCWAATHTATEAGKRVTAAACQVDLCEINGFLVSEATVDTWVSCCASAAYSQLLDSSRQLSPAGPHTASRTRLTEQAGT